MADIIVIDTNILKNISEGNQPVADALHGYLNAHRKVVIARAAYNELVGGAKTPKLAGQYREMLKDLNIEIAEPGPAAARQGFLADNIARNPPKNAPGQIKDYGSGTQDPPKPGDAFIAAQTKALDGQLWTLDGKLRSRAQALGVKVVEPAFPSVPGGNDDPDLGRRLLGMNPKVVGADGRVAPATKTGGTAGVHAVVGVADTTVPEFVPPSAKGLAKVGGIQLAFEGLNFVLNLVNDAMQKKQVEAELDKIRGTVASARANNPRLGVLLIFYYRQRDAPQESIMKPGAEFNSLSWGLGVTIDEARRAILSEPTISAGLAPNQRAFSQEQWIPPLQKTEMTAAKCPFPPVAVGRFALGTSNKARFQLVEFSLVGGFDDVIETTVELPPDTNAEFVVLKAPSAVAWYNINGKQTTGVPLVDAQTSNSNTIRVVDLDPYTPFHAKAAMVFPLNEWTEQVFGQVRPTDGYQVLTAYVNFSMIRWVRPENLQVLRFI